MGTTFAVHEIDYLIKAVYFLFARVSGGSLRCA
jgi:hypothetical protein